MVEGGVYCCFSYGALVRIIRLKSSKTFDTLCVRMGAFINFSAMVGLVISHNWLNLAVVKVVSLHNVIGTL